MSFTMTAFRGSERVKVISPASTYPQGIVRKANKQNRAVRFAADESAERGDLDIASLLGRVCFAGNSKNI
ncbi:MAG: hypothetical protein JSW58_06430 [Candidatus Latescibacterota bacterium]|nr:MAG: hypothetical protein JSW58_06430 [Candidatus Latescibacterota bacterium]